MTPAPQNVDKMFQTMESDHEHQTLIASSSWIFAGSDHIALQISCETRSLLPRGAE